MEVMSVGIPVICSNIYGNTEIVNKANGFIHNSNEDLNFSKISKSILNNHLNIKKKNKKRNLAQLTILKKFDLKICQSDFNKIIYRYYI
jgi:glycosyltransferase involved in cell wall biosynthesis